MENEQVRRGRGGRLRSSVSIVKDGPNGVIGVRKE